jgi:NhaP-type Na+/H+ or K+/H+ antiporter
MTELAFALLAKVSVNPSPNGLPGSDAVEKLLNGLAFYVLLGCTAGMLLGAVLYAFGSRSHNYSQAANGRSMMIYAAVGAFVAGATPAIINFFQQAGGTVK